MRTLLSVLFSPQPWKHTRLRCSLFSLNTGINNITASSRGVFRFSSLTRSNRSPNISSATMASKTAPPPDYAHGRPRVEVLSSQVEKPELDDRSYRLVKLLDNKLECLIVHDPKTDKSSAAMDVHVGHLSDPEDFPGLAHALEHCLFLGMLFNHRYLLISFQAPRSILKRTIIKEHSGSSNAFTGYMMSEIS